MIVKTETLEGPALDWAVSKAVGAGAEIYGKSVVWCGFCGDMMPHNFRPSTEWIHGGPLIEINPCDLTWNGIDGKPICWKAMCEEGSGFDFIGPTPLIAACRAIVSAKLGDEVDVPEELIGSNN